MGFYVYHVKWPREDRKFHETERGAKISMCKLNHHFYEHGSWMPGSDNIDAPYAWAKEDQFEKMFPRVD